MTGYLFSSLLELWEQIRISRKEHARRKTRKMATKIPLKRRVLCEKFLFSQMISVGSEAF